MQLFSYWRSSSSYRVRIALELKGLQYTITPVHLVRDGGEQRSDAYRSMNPQQLVPMLVDGDLRLTQSMSIIDYLDRRYPDGPLIPDDTNLRAQVLSFAQAIASDIQPLQNLSVLQHLVDGLGLSADMRQQWAHHWIQKGLLALETVLQSRPQTPYCFGDTPTLADVCLIPQMYNAARFGVDFEQLPRLRAVTDHCCALPEFARAHPDQQPDAE